ncbi:fibronectin type III domain-containing protein [Solwaraspora sp. WMMD1047]|uniref:fibronectin type III domain-containing protein n=1 Tax=Solwaraspora sp. WMMD1047 TaxID=3016102 RepID=UPI002415DA29|nr:fibronectin type III domain-containing protein [Solwaraspora sp. WMMD1047]MDG4832791.1 fibronectin type III domain-containing protein [Solwaraspora sp. WMMD1047]
MPSPPRRQGSTALAVASLAAALAAALVGGAPAAAGDTGPATPVALWASTSGTAITVSWQQPPTGPRISSFRVYEGDQVVARTTTTATQLYVPFGSSHTYTVTAVDRDGRESAPSDPVTGRSWLSGVNPECLPTTALPITVTDVSASALSLSWPRHPLGGELELRVNGVGLGTTSLTSARIGGLAPATDHQIGLYRRNGCTGSLEPVGGTSATTAAGTAERPAAPTGLTVTGRTDSTIGLTWTAPAGPAPARYAVYSGGTRVAVARGTSATVRRLFHATWHRFTVAALDAAGNESAHTAAVSAGTETCLARPPRPVELTATALSPSSVRLTWTFAAAAESYTIFDRDTAVATAHYPSAVVSGLPSGSRHSYRVSATLPQSCGETARSQPARVTTLAGPTARPATPAGLAVTGNIPTGWPSGAELTLTWSASAGAEPAVGYRVYEGGTVVGETDTTSLTLPVGAATRHSYTVVAVDAAGNESAASPSVTAWATFLPPP